MTRIPLIFLSSNPAPSHNSAGRFAFQGGHAPELPKVTLRVAAPIHRCGLLGPGDRQSFPHDSPGYRSGASAIGEPMPAAQNLIVERASDDVFRITWWDYTGKRREELATRKTLTHRCDVLTYPDGLDMAALMGNTSHTSDAPSVAADTGMEHAP